MTTLLAAPPTIRTLADLLDRLGDIPLDRIRFRPAPGTAKLNDVIAVQKLENRTCELLDGVLVEKHRGWRESYLTLFLSRWLLDIVEATRLGIITGPDGMTRLFPGLVRAPDLAFTSWDRIPGGTIPKEPIPDIVPDLTIEILSESNTPREMARKRREYFAAGVRLVWMVDPRKRIVKVYTGPEQFRTLDESQTLEGGDVLPGFALPLCDLFAELDRKAPR